MAIAEMFVWWYSGGWRAFIAKSHSALSHIIDLFSMGDLLRTLFKPFRQISAETASSSSSMDLRFHIFLDRLVSRCIGFVSRLVLLIAGSIIILLGGILSIILILLWPIIPLLPIAGIVLSIIGVTL